MINVSLRLLDFMDSTPVSGADVTVTAKVLARWQFVTSGGPLQPGKIVTSPDLDGAEVLTRSGKSEVDGTIQCSFDASAAFAKQRRRPSPGPGVLLDVIAVLSVQVARAGLVRSRSLYHEGIL